MLSAIFNGLKLPRRRPTVSRRNPRSTRPSLESMEGRQLMATWMMVGDARVVEGTGGSSPMQFTVSLLIPTHEQVTVNYQTVDGTANAWHDYIPTSGTLTFAPGEMFKTVTVPVIGDNVFEPDELFHLSLSNASANCWVIQPSNTGIILDDDAPVSAELSINSSEVVRGWDGAVRTMNFTVSLAAASSSPVTVRASTMGLTALAGIDFEQTSTVLTFAPGETTTTFSVKVYGSSTDIWDEILWVSLSESSAPIKNGWAFGTLKFGA